MQQFFFIKVNSKYVRINWCDIIYVESLRNYVKIVTGTQHYVILNTLKKMEELLPADSFCRVHRSYIVAVGKIASFDNNMVYFNTDQVPIGDQYKGSLEQKVMILRNAERMQEVTGFRVQASEYLISGN
jgi:DNA-binding LytR/AlgR family response regulator